MSWPNHPHLQTLVPSKARGAPIGGGSTHLAHKNFNTSKIASAEPSDEDQNAVARRYIFGIEEFELWKKSVPFKKLEIFLEAINNAIKGKKQSQSSAPSNILQKIVTILDGMEKATESFPPKQIQARYGNPAFRDWFGHLLEKATDWMKELLQGTGKEQFAEELGIYFHNCFGNRTRIDYGSGHEASFVMWLCLFHELGLIKAQDFEAVGLIVFPRYLRLCRFIQTTYMLEPAGSRGVHGLDDFFFVSYYWGSSQFIGNSEHIKPRDVLKKERAEELKKEYMYAFAIDYIHQVKTGMFAEHSGLLHSIGTVPHQLWEKVNYGLWKMYHDEVLNKFVVIQHFVFGTILPFAPFSSASVNSTSIPSTSVNSTSIPSTSINSTTSTSVPSAQNENN